MAYWHSDKVASDIITTASIIYTKSIISMVTIYYICSYMNYIAWKIYISWKTYIACWVPNPSLNSYLSHKESKTLFSKLYSYVLHIRTKQQRWRIFKSNHVQSLFKSFVDTSSNDYNCYYIPNLLVVCYHIVDFAHGHAEWLIMSQLHKPAY